MEAAAILVSATKSAVLSTLFFRMARKISGKIAHRPFMFS
jgi:hypothetical protein